MNVRSIIVWWVRLVWAALAVAAAPAWGDALASSSSAVQATAAAGAWLVWGVALVAAAALSTVSLTVARLAMTVAVPAQITVAIHTPGGWAVAAVALSVAAAVAVMSAEFAQACVQASAYGAEERYPLRPPAPFVAPMAIAWSVLAAAWITGPLSLAAGSWIPGIALSAVAVTATVVLGRRFHRMARRWMVLVPAGVVVHDPLLLAETVMVRRNELVGVRLASDTASALDLTGLTWGAAVQIDAREPQPVVTRGGGQDGGPKAQRAQAILVAPSRPGLVLSAVRRARLA